MYTANTALRQEQAQPIAVEVPSDSSSCQSSYQMSVKVQLEADSAHRVTSWVPSLS